ncbi:hypothetical protein D3C86_1623470 [compost metagenome]
MNVNQMMRDDLLLRLTRFGGSDVHAAIHLHRITGNYFTIEALGNFQAKFGLAYCGGTK